jgi:putative transposase
MSLPQRRSSELRKGRMSLPGARYFVTCSAVRPTVALATSACARPIKQTITRLAFDGDLVLSCATIMPDHMHIVFTLDKRLSLARLVAKAKGLTAHALEESGARWQANYYEHRLRPDEKILPYLRYIFMNPYRAGLIERNVVWPHWIAGDGCEEMTGMLEDGLYPPEVWMTGEEELSEKAVGRD